jgi:hypothetical protein
MQASSDNRTTMFSMIEQWKASGLSQKAYCRQQNLSYHVFHYWYKVYRDEKGVAPNDNATFVPLRIEAQPVARSLFELILPNGKRLVFHQQPSAEFLKALL